MPSCVVKSCKNNSKSHKKSHGVTFHLFPINNEIKNKWIVAIRNSRNDPEWLPSKTSVVCSDHFDNTDLYTTNRGLRRVTKSGYPKKDVPDLPDVTIDDTTLPSAFSVSVLDSPDLPNTAVDCTVLQSASSPFVSDLPVLPNAVVDSTVLVLPSASSAYTPTIEDRTPPCPFEFFSVLSDEKLCGANYTQYKDVNNICPSVIKFSDLTATCDNPIETQWRFTKKYGVTEKYNEVICKGKDFCEIFTSYEITPEHVIFRIINSTNDVIYSRIMKAKNRNYICVEDCGRLNPNTRKVAKGDKPLKLDLLTVRKTKREDVLNDNNDSVTKRDVLNERSIENLPKKLPKKEDVLNEIDDNVPKKEHFSNEMNEGLHLPKELTKEDVLIEKNDSDPKREHLLNEMNEGLPTEGTKREVLNDVLPPIEEDMSLSNFGGDEYVLVSIEQTRPLQDLDMVKKKMSIQENSLHKIKTRGMKERQQNNLNFIEERFLLKPTVTPSQKLKKEADHKSYGDTNLEMEY